MKKFVKDRNEAMLSLDKDKIMAYMKKYDIEWIPSCEEVFWAGIHKARLAITGISESEKDISRQWLTDHGYRHDMFQ